jgi:fatty acid desaturase
MEPETTDKKIQINIGEYSYDISKFKHPGGNIIGYMTFEQDSSKQDSSKQDSSGKDATQVFEEIHYRSKKARSILNSLPRTKITSETVSTTEQKMLEDFAQFRKSLEDRGFFAPSYIHITYRILELAAIYYFAIWSMQYSIATSILLLGLFGGRCGWVQHEGGHNSFTCNIKTDKIVQNVFIGFGLLADGSMWNSMHYKHHACTQKIGYDMDLDTAPFVLFYPNKDFDVKKQILERFDITKGDSINESPDSSRNDLVGNPDKPSLLEKAVKLWLKYQAYTFLPVTSGIFVMLFWLLYLHPRKIIRDKNTAQAILVSVGHLSRILLFMCVGKATFYRALLYHFIALWCSGVYLFGHFSLSHTFMPVVESNENPNWVRYALEHTVDIEPQNYGVSWVMGHLNNQVIHHLFPSMPQYRGPEVSKELAEFCKKWDLKYTVITYREAWENMFANLRKVGEDIQ